MQTTKSTTNFGEDCQKNFERQQERLKAMSGASDKIKTVSADIMIENLLKESFKKPNHVSVAVEKVNHFYIELPLWLQCESSAVPPLYKQLWSLVALTSELADTQKVSQLLLTSGLQVDALGFIWSLANKIIPGQLTKQEFYIVLALVGLAQAGCAFHSLNTLKQISTPSIPFFQGSLPTPPLLQSYVSQNIDIPPINSFQPTPNIQIQHLMTQRNKSDNEKEEIRSVKEINISNEKQSALYLNECVTSDLLAVDLSSGKGDGSKIVNSATLQETQINKGPLTNSNFPCIGSSPTAELEDDFSEFQSVPARLNETLETMTISRADLPTDEFTDFQSADAESLDPFKTVIVAQTKEPPKIPLPKSFSEKYTNLNSNIIKISQENERRLKVLSKTEGLSSLPESKISSSNKVSTSISVLGSSRGIGSRLANHSLGIKPEKENYYKHQKIKAAPATAVPSVTLDEEIIFSIKPVFGENLKSSHLNNSKTSSTFLLKETKIQNEDVLENSLNDQNSSALNFSTESSKENTRQIEIPMLGTFNETVLPTKKKFTSCCSDLISVQEDRYSALREMDLVVNQENFSQEKYDEFGDFLSANIPPPNSIEIQTASTSISSVILGNDEPDNWENWNFSGETISKENNFINEPKSVTTKIEKAGDLFGSFTFPSVAEKSKCIQSTSDPDVAERKSIFFSSESNSHSTNNSADKNNFVLFKDQIKQNNLVSQSKSDQFSNQLEIEFWDFLSPEGKPSVEVTLSRQGSLPSLDLKISTPGEIEKEVIWRKCLECCHSLMQEGFEKFNGIPVKSVLDEVFSVSKTSSYLNCLYIVYQISKRIRQNFKNPPSIQEDLEKYWGRLQELCFEYNIKLTSSKDEISEGSSQCSICLKYIVCNLINQGAYSYHPSCANLWINFVEETLPFST